MGEGVDDRYARSYPTGTVLFREGESGSEMFVIQSGQVQLTRRLGREDKVIAVLPAGEFFGEMAILNNRPRSATATVSADAHMLVLDSSTFEAMIRKNSEIALRLIRKFSARLEQANQQIESLLLRDTNHRIVQALRKLAHTQGTPEESGVRISTTTANLSSTLGVPHEEIASALERLTKVGLVDPAADGTSFLVAEDGRLQDFLEFQEIKQKYGR